MPVNSLTKLMANLETVVINALRNDPEVTNAVIQTGQAKIEELVYSYQPKQYRRTYELYNKWEKENIDQGIKIYNDRRDGDKYIPKVIETGEGYDYTGFGYEYEQPRPFISETVKELQNSKKHVEALKASLKRNGIKVG